MQVALLEETTNAELFLSDDDYCAEEKLNGRRMLLVKRGNVVRAYSRNGVEYVAPLAVVKTALSFPCDLTLDGELVGEQFYIFDSLGMGDMPFAVRRESFKHVTAFPIVRQAVGESAKRELFNRVKAEGGEGMVFKHLAAPYQEGQRTYGFKFKFYKTETFTVADVNIAKSTVGLTRNGEDCGRVVFPFNSIWPKVGELWEIRYDEISAKGKLMRPQLLMRRDDLETALT